MKRWFIAIVSVLMAYSQIGHAKVIGSDGSCDLGSVTLDSIRAISFVDGLPADPSLIAPRSYDSSSCIGNEGNDDGAAYQPFVEEIDGIEYYNVGLEGNGLLNGGGTEKKPAFFDGSEFIDPEDYQDFADDGTFTDPGWIHLAHFNGALEATYDSVSIEGVGSLNIGDLLTITIDQCTDKDGETDGENAICNWTLTTKLDIIQDVQAILGEATFDHLAISIKAANGFTVYDFDFNDIFAQELSANPGSTLNFLTPYELSGTLSTADLGRNGFAGISHINFWARDPSEPADVSEPRTVLVFALVLLALAGLSRRMQA
ncbi:hypothetical protein [Aliagarivorans taiwanensis]|uniref:hypothetical protein n=1 Tax=Aliagarivorans taiwanensis TaxID=561966 RepID=UPI00047DA607|nr:hypothetical protein [Aliagarivorans taiwanensis]